MLSMTQACLTDGKIPEVGPALLERAASTASQSHDHLIADGVICATEGRGFTRADNASIAEIVVDASEGFIPLWQPNTVLRWRFQERSVQQYVRPGDMKAAIEALLAEAILAWGDAAPIKFSHNADAYDFEIVVKDQDQCNPKGCVLASAFFPDAGRHQLNIFPQMFTQVREEQVETLAHEIGHIFGLRHFFALVSESGLPAEIFGEHTKFSIMNYGADSKMAESDRRDLKALYQAVWTGKLTQINGTPIRLVRPYHAAGRELHAVTPG